MCLSISVILIEKHIILYGNPVTMTQDYEHIGTRFILIIWERGNTGMLTMLITCDPGNTGKQSILIIWVSELILWVSELILWVSELILWGPAGAGGGAGGGGGGDGGVPTILHIW